MIFLCSMMNEESGKLLLLGVNANIERYGCQNWKWEGNLPGNYMHG